MGASTGMIGTARAQYHLRQSMVLFNAYTMNRPEIMVSLSEKKFDQTGRLTDEMTRQKVEEFVVAMLQWIVKLK